MADKPSKPAKRRVKNPETFRERALKASEVSDKPKRTAKLRSATGKVTSPAAKPFKRVWRAKPVRIIRTPFRWVGKILVPVYVRRSWKELKQVTWPRWKQSWRLTYAVIVFAFIFGALIAAVDYGLDRAFKDILLK